MVVHVVVGLPGGSCGCGSTWWFYLVVLHVVAVHVVSASWPGVHVVRVLPGGSSCSRGSNWFFMWLGFYLAWGSSCRRGHTMCEHHDTGVRTYCTSQHFCQWSFKPERL